MGEGGCESSTLTYLRFRLVFAHLGRHRCLEVLPAGGAGRVPPLPVVVSRLVHGRCGGGGGGGGGGDNADTARGERDSGYWIGFGDADSSTGLRTGGDFADATENTASRASVTAATDSTVRSVVVVTDNRFHQALTGQRARLQLLPTAHSDVETSALARQCYRRRIRTSKPPTAHLVANATARSGWNGGINTQAQQRGRVSVSASSWGRACSQKRKATL